MKIRILLLLSVILIIFYFSWKSSPNIAESWLIPGWLAHWSNENYNFRTAVPFLAAGIIAGSFRGSLFLFWGLLLLIALGAEIGQLWLSHRSFDIWDILYGGLGSAMGLWVSRGIYIMFQKRSK